MADDLLTQGIAAVKAGNKQEARRLLDAAIRQSPNDERTWGWFYNVCENDTERLKCLKEILRINPNHQQARQKYNELTGMGLHTATIIQQPIQSTGDTDALGIIMIVLLILLGIFWIGVGLLQITLSADFFAGIWNIAVSIVNFLGISDIVQRKKRVPKEMVFLAVFGSILGLLNIYLTGAYLQACVIPFYIVLGVLSQVNKNKYVN
jgi:tetratricopeptide (TPR) repeat protein